MKHKALSHYTEASQSGVKKAESDSQKFRWLSEQLAFERVNLVESALGIEKEEAQTASRESVTIDSELLKVLHRSLLFLAEIDDLYAKTK